MKKLVLIISILSITLLQAQHKKPTYKKFDGLVKVTYYHDNGKIKETGFFKGEKLTGVWKRFDRNGKKIALAHYKQSKKVGTWFFWNKDVLTEIDYKNHKIYSVNTWQENSKIAIK